ncbi:MAG: hypothetical protein GTO76_02720 [Planctomycetales bacterium]|nr:hypothetical protein [Planctomycetales bacterium]NIN07591.1 hypothetical protein [Planctomycetales bacterium]NIN76713.1 hypothetical protein [Planctomycetales bacterium]NIO33902.1 hypothetical protein [Planctomycetales bacterium]NIO45710.1 hypothetical protein [Planctomycetales bacterium]
MRNLGSLIAAAGLCLGLGAVPVQGQSPEELRAFMRAKLDHSQKVLEGLCVEDFDRIAKNAQQLALLSQESNWRVLQTEDYVQYSLEFRRAAHAMVTAAEKKNLDAATLAYVDMTMKCVKCHKYVRGIRTAAGPGQDEKRLGQRLLQRGPRLSTIRGLEQ